ncbi:O-phosphoseryl-tRNA(Sec) selenium transferase isoform X3 [Ceratitis capitata]|uniref:O-phosphoseryl-tRNA(Sec) selenium transferase isoform X3 n=1 Tax=Ceratitis capitata TaxID=7213 RepID=UPI000A0FD216|nr:O-phosphoseryl-tRNA(Sec) selenium transferase isoform X3 [Ceratitis capitata]
MYFKKNFRMDLKRINISNKLVPDNYLKLAQNAQKSRETEERELLEKRKLPINGWTDDHIEELLQQLSLLDSNNFPKKAGVGEREARIACCSTCCTSSLQFWSWDWPVRRFDGGATQSGRFYAYSQSHKLSLT